jgi:hypothetical protein
MRSSQKNKDAEPPPKPGSVEGGFVVDQFNWITDVKQRHFLDPRVLVDEMLMKNPIVWGGTPEMLQDLLNTRESQGYELVSTVPRMAGSVILIWKKS